MILKGPGPSYFLKRLVNPKTNLTLTMKLKCLVLKTKAQALLQQPRLNQAKKSSLHQAFIKQPRLKEAMKSLLQTALINEDRRPAVCRGLSLRNSYG